MPERARGPGAVRRARAPSNAGRTPSAAADVDVVIVATTNDALTPIAVAAVEAGKHVLVEKPAARTVAELDRLIAAARAHEPPRPGRLQPSLPPGAARRRGPLVDAGALGPLMFIRGRYGHGGRVGYEREWRADPGDVRRRRADRSGRAPDRSRRAGSWATSRTSTAWRATYFWNMPVDDNALHAAATAAGGQVALLHVSCTEWKNLFSFEIYGRDGKLADRRPGRQLRRRAADALPDAARRWGRPRRRSGSTRAATDPGRSSSPSSSTTSGSAATPAAGLAAARAALVVVEAIYAQSGYDPRPEAAVDDHHAQSAANHARRRRHRPAVVLPRARRLPDRRGDRQVRLRHGDAAVHARHLS